MVYILYKILFKPRDEREELASYFERILRAMRPDQLVDRRGGIYSPLGAIVYVPQDIKNEMAERFLELPEEERTFSALRSIRFRLVCAKYIAEQEAMNGGCSGGDAC